MNGFSLTATYNLAFKYGLLESIQVLSSALQIPNIDFGGIFEIFNGLQSISEFLEDLERLILFIIVALIWVSLSWFIWFWIKKSNKIKSFWAILINSHGTNQTTDETKTLEENQGEVKKEVNPKETVAETTPEPEGVNLEELDIRQGLAGSTAYMKGSDTLYTGEAYKLYPNGQKLIQGSYKDGKKDGLFMEWHKNGQKSTEGNWKDGNEDGLFMGWHKNGEKNSESTYRDGKRDGLYAQWHYNGQNFLENKYKDGEEVEGSKKWWNRKGEPVDSEVEALK